jgi:hypothetical protein
MMTFEGRKKKSWRWVVGSNMSVILGNMQQNGPKLFRRSQYNKDSVSMMLEKIPPTKDHEGDFRISLLALKGYLNVD